MIKLILILNFNIFIFIFISWSVNFAIDIAFVDIYLPSFNNSKEEK